MLTLCVLFLLPCAGLAEARTCQGLPTFDVPYRPFFLSSSVTDSVSCSLRLRRFELLSHLLNARDGHSSALVLIC
jgi:hypothetical protein